MFFDILAKTMKSAKFMLYGGYIFGGLMVISFLLKVVELGNNDSKVPIEIPDDYTEEKEIISDEDIEMGEENKIDPE